MIFRKVIFSPVITDFTGKCFKKDLKDEGQTTSQRKSDEKDETGKDYFF